MPLIPALRSLLDQLGAGGLTPSADLGEVRAAALVGANALAAQVAQPGPEVGAVSTVQIPVGGGAITLRLYQPATVGPHPVHLYFHGGGWMAGTIEETFVDNVCRERAALAGYVTVAVEYRLAPEHKFPVPLDDCYAALLWVAEHATEYQGDPARITVGGGSAGANLAAAVALRARDERGPGITFQLLEVPALDLTWAASAHDEYGKGYGLTSAEAEMSRDAYLRSVDDATNPYASPLLAEDLTGLPPAHIISSEFDLLRPDGPRYAERLTAAGVPATYTLGEGHVHGSSQFTALLPEAAAWRDEVVAVLRAHAADTAPQR